MQVTKTYFQELIGTERQYIVPLFQREYSWREKEWENLWNDMEGLCETDGEYEHFMGPLVTQQEKTNPNDVPKYYLIDGQQRIATISMLLIVLRNELKNNEEKLWEQIHNEFLVNQYKDGAEHYKLQLSQKDQTNYQHLVDTWDEPEKENLFKDVYAFFKEKLNGGDLNIHKIKDVVSKRTLFVSILLDSEDDPYLIYESLNTKGIDLTQADMIRNYFFMKISPKEPEKQKKIYKNVWLPMQESLGEHLTLYIRHYLMKSGEIILEKERGIYNHLKRKVDNSDALCELKELVRFSKYYEKILDPDKEENDKIRHLLLRLNRIKITTYPFLLNCYEECHKGEISLDEFIKLIEITENYLVRRFVCNIPANSLNKIFPVVYSHISNDPDGFVEGLKRFLQNKNYPDDEKFKENLIYSKLYGGGDKKSRTMLILESIEEYYGNKKEVLSKELEIEHIMPQKPSKWWDDYLSENSEESYKLLHTIGNLTLTNYNSELSNRDFNYKKEYLIEKSHLELNKYFKDINSWKGEDIHERSEHLADIALKIWQNFTIDNNDKKIKKPKMLSVCGEKYPVNSWRDVFERTINTIIELYPDKFEIFKVQFPHLVASDKHLLRNSRKLKNNMYLNVNLSGKDIERYSHKAMKIAGLKERDWKML